MLQVSAKWGKTVNKSRFLTCFLHSLQAQTAPYYVQPLGGGGGGPLESGIPTTVTKAVFVPAESAGNGALQVVIVVAYRSPS